MRMNNKTPWIIIGLIILLAVGFFVYRRSTRMTAVVPSPSAEAIIEPSPSPSAAMKEVIVNLAQQNNSTESGKATLTEVAGKVKVSIDLTGAPSTPQPAHIHTGKCPNPGDVKYPLTNVVNGKSETQLAVSLDTLMSELPLAVNVHKSAALIKTYVACGDITQTKTATP